MKHAQTDREASFERVVADSLRTRAEESVTDRCLDAETLAAWADDTIDARERAVVEAHTADCGRCQALLAAMARTQPAAATAPWWRVHMMTWLVPMSAAAAALILWIAVPIRSTPSAIEGAATVAKSQAAANAEPATPSQTQRDLLPSQPSARERRDGTANGAPRSQARPTERAADELQYMAATRETDRRLQSADAPKLDAALAKKEARPASSPVAADEERQKALADKVAVLPPPTAAPATSQLKSGPSQAAQEQAQLKFAAPAVAGGRAEAANEPARASGLLAARARSAPPLVVASQDARSRWRPLATGAVEHSTDGGSTWQVQVTGVTTAMTAGASPSALVCWLVGPRGMVLVSTDGNTWRQMSVGEAIDLVAVSASDDKHATATAADGRTFSTTDGGVSWQK